MPAARRSVATLGLERLMLMSLALVLSLVACQEPEPPTGPALSQVALPNSITLTYICGNSFRVRNTNPTVLTVTWDVYKTTEQGTLTLAAKPAAAPYSETYFTTVNKGTVRLFLDGVLIQTKANGNKPVCQLPATPWPKLGNGFPSFDTTRVLTSSNGEVQLFRTDIKIRFEPGTSDASKQALFGRFSMTVVGEVSDGAFFVRIPDPGMNESDLYDAIDRIIADSVVRHAAPIVRGPVEVRTNARYPEDGTGFRRTDWLQSSASTWALRAIRAPLAWGCENGAYGGISPRIGLLEWRHNFANPDLAPSSPDLRRADTLGTAVTQANHIAQFSAASVDSFIAHASWTSTLLSASGDNGEGLAGVLWKSHLYLYEALDPARYPIPFVTGFYRISSAVLKDSPRILSISVDQPVTRGASERLKQFQIGDVELGVETMLEGSDSLIVVVATGDEAFVGTREAYEQRAQPGLLISAFLRLKPRYPGRIVIVSGTSESGQFAANFSGTSAAGDGSNFFTGLTDLLAPAASVTVQTTGGGTAVASGTSLSAPLVAGVLGSLLAMNPQLSSMDLVGYLRLGAKTERIDPATGVSGLPSAIAVPGASDVVYQLDAYGALSLLAGSDPASPICGFPVITSLVNNPETGELETSVRIARPGTPLEVFRGEVGSVTVAQGGRRIGIDGYTTSKDVLFQNGAWSGVHDLPFRGYRQFLERDTAFIDYSTGPELLTIRGPGGPRGPFNVCEAFTGLFATACYSGPIASTGEWAHVTVSWNNSDLTGCGADRAFYGSYLVPVTFGGARQVLREVLYNPCPPDQGAWNLPGQDVLAWRADGAVAWVGQSDESYSIAPGVPDSLNPYPGIVITTTGIETKFKQVSVLSDLTVLGARTVTNRLAYALGWRADGSTLISYEYAGLDWSNCQRSVRAGLAPEIEVADSAGPVPWCGNTVMEPLPTSRLGAPLASALRANGTGALHSGRPLSAGESRLRALQERPVPRIVLVN